MRRGSRAGVRLRYSCVLRVRPGAGGELVDVPPLSSQNAYARERRMSATEARARLDAARRMRAVAEVALVEEYAASAHFLAVKAGDTETAYHSRACLGHMYLWRAEYELSYKNYREALRVAEGFGLARWIPPAHHDCFISGAEAGFGECHENADPALADWHLPGSRTWAFVHDIYRSLVRGTATREARVQAVDHLRQSAISASWCINQPAPGGPWYPEYRAKFERVTVYATMSHACGLLHGEGVLDPKHLQRALNLFEMAADEQGSDEGYALNLIDAAQGAWGGGMKEEARNYATRAIIIAQKRGESEVAKEAEALRERWG
jgi:hypothetical protein